jgi:hypothetical protein
MQRRAIIRLLASTATLSVTFGVVGAVGCSANNDQPLIDRRTGGTGNGTGNGGSANGTGIGGAQSLGGNTFTGNGGYGGDGCPHFSLTWQPKTPTVFVLADRSNTMFYTIPSTSTTYWNEMRTATLAVMQDLQNDVRFGFAAFSGQSATCPDMPGVPPGSGNYQQIADVYNGLGQSQYKDTPIILALNAASDALWTDGVDGPKYIMLVTDSEFDYCNDPPVDCAPDSAIWHVQQLYKGMDDAGASKPPIGTIVFGIGAAATQTISPKVLDGLAQAGAGQAVGGFEAFGNLYYNCKDWAGWSSDLAKTGKTGQPGVTVADYSATPGPATAYKPNPADQAALTDALRTALAGVKSCTFDLTSANITINTADANLGTHAGVKINGTAVPYDPTNGWHAPTDTQVALEGSACDTWRTKESTQIDFNFPCETIIVH